MTTIHVPLSWLREYVDVVSSPKDLADLLTMSGTDTKVSSPRADEWRGIWVGRVEKLEKHPNADRLLLATVNYGHGTKRVVTGAVNLKEGDVVPYAEVGAALISGHTGERVRLKPRSLLGIKSEGMVCSERELGLGEDHEGILVLDPSLKVGAPLADAIGEMTLVAELSPNRSDCLGVVGIARETAVLLETPLREPALDPWPSREPNDFTVVIDDAKGCPRYAAGIVRNVRVAASPESLRRRLVAAGMRPINNVVDVTNYVMLELGQPLHAFDRRHLRGATIRIRRARAGERLLTLDGVERTLDPSVLVIADAERPVALAGIIGGEDSEIAEDTTDVILEVASFEPRGIGRTATALGLHGSEGSAAARRFAWDLSPELVPIALRRAVRLLRELAGAETTAAVDLYPEPRPVPTVRLPFGDFERVLGVELPREEILDTLHRLDCRYAEDGDTLVVTPPPWRTDIAIAEDVVEEAARVIGYERIPVRIPIGPLPVQERHPIEEFRERARDALVGLGLQEVVCYALIDPRWLEMLTADGSRAGPEPLRVTNPTSIEQSVARTTLDASLLDTARRNLKIASSVALFEVAPTYLPRAGDLPEERWTVGVLLAGRAQDAPRHWVEGEARPYDLSDLRGLLDAALEAVGVALPDPDPGSPGLHPGRSAEVHQGERVVMRFGQLDPRVAERWELPAATFLASLDLALLAERRVATQAAVPPRFPGAYRDLAVVVDEATTWRAVRDEVRAATAKRLASLVLLDLYRGPQIPDGKKSFAMRLEFRSEEGTLEEAEIERLLRRVTARLTRSLGATARG